jgi:hypothetical protein
VELSGCNGVDNTDKYAGEDDYKQYFPEATDGQLTKVTQMFKELFKG